MGIEQPAAANPVAPTRRATPPLRWERGALALILTLHVALGVLYSVTIPVWEAYDEWGHYAFARYLVSHWRLPREGEAIVQANDEGRQPPLYYLLAGLAAAPVDAPEDFFPQRNLPLNDNPAGGVNFAVHGPDEGFPYTGASLALHLMRWASVLLGTVGVWATYAAARCWFPGRPLLALGAAGLHAFWPQFLFNGSVVTNDVLASVGGSLFVLALGHWGRQVWTLRVRGPRAGRAWLGLTATALILLLSKATTYGLLLLGVGIALAAAARRVMGARWRGRRLVAAVAGLALLLLALAAALVALWPALSRLALVVHSAAVIIQFVRRLWQGGIAWGLAAESLRYGLISFWASFGWGNLPAPGWTYSAAACAALAAGLGLIRALAGSRARTLAIKVGLLLACVLAVIAVPFLYTLYLNSPYFFPGRYFLSALTPLSLLLALGLRAWWPERLWGTPSRCPSGRAPSPSWRTAALAASLALLAALGASFPFTVIAPAYRPPPLLPPAAEAGVQHQLYSRFGDQILLVGYTVDDSRSHPGGQVALTLYWRALASVQRNYVLNVVAVGPDGVNYAAHRAYPGRGNFATSLWRPGDFFRETHLLPIPADSFAPARGRFGVYFELPAIGAAPGGGAFPEAELSHALFGEFKVAAAPPADGGSQPAIAPQVPAAYQLGEAISLLGYSLDFEAAAPAAIHLTLFWRADRADAERAGDWTVALSLLDPAGRVVAQADSPPLAGGYLYPTRLWDSGEQVVDAHPLPLPAGLPCRPPAARRRRPPRRPPGAEGGYRLAFGLYDPGSGARLPIAGEGPLAVRDDLFWLDLPLAPPACRP